MKKNFSEISEYFKVAKFRNDKRVIIFLVCLLIATILWFLNALGKDYTTTVSYPIKFVDPPKNEFVSNEMPLKFDLKVEAHGFTLLRQKLSLSVSPIILNITNITERQQENDGVYNIQTSTLINTVTSQVSKEITVSGILPENFKIILDSLTTKSVPVELNVKLEFMSQYNLKGPVKITPENVSITGPAILLDSIDSVRTEYKVFDRLEADEEKTVSLFHPKNTTVKPAKVSLKIPVEKFTEKELEIPVQIINKPENMTIKFFPSEVKITFMVGLSEFENLNASDFNAIVDYNTIILKQENPEVEIEKKPSNIEILRISPETVEYLIETE